MNNTPKGHYSKLCRSRQLKKEKTKQAESNKAFLIKKTIGTMQKNYFIFCLLISTTFLLNAKSITIETAEQVAINFFLTKNISTSQSINNITADLVLEEKAVMLNNRITDTPTILYYVFNMNNQGFVIVSGDDNLIPIIGYSIEKKFPEEQMPIHIAKWFHQYKNEIRYILENGIEANDDIQQEWAELLSTQSGIPESTLLGVDPLLTTKWGQSPHVNDECPYNYLVFQHTVTGCVATAMAQLMKYWNYPSTGSGYHSYDASFYGNQAANFGGTNYNWSAMPNIVNSSNNAVSTLMYHCGVSVNMNYGYQSSGAFVIEDSPTPNACSEYALKNYFGYSSDLQGVKRENYSSTGWINLMKSELDAGRPILHAGFGNGGGHAFVCDGYDDNDYFHFNWGWGGNSDGYFLNTSLNPGSLGTGGGSGGYNSDQHIIIGVEPSTTNSQDIGINLYSSITISPNPIQWGEGFTVNADIYNNVSTSFFGDITAALFDDNGNFIDYIETLNEANGLEPNFHYTNGLDFTSSGINATPGDYFIGIYVNPGNQWYSVGNGGYTNFIPVSIVYSNDIELYSEIVPSGIPLIENQSAEFDLDFANFGSNDYNGSFSIDIHDLEGNWIQTIEEFTGMSLCTNCHYQNGLTFSTSNLNLASGSYLLAAWEKPDGGNWDLVGSTDFNNPIQITVSAPQLQPDIYENNNNQSNSYNLPLSFLGNSANLKTTGSNSHIEDDYDYYKVKFPAGYDYIVTPRVHDSYNSGNGLTYTSDVLFSYNSNGTWSDAFDDTINGNVSITGNSTLYFQVAPYFQGQLGTYLLELEISRTPTTAVYNILEDSDIVLSPNPTSHYLNIESINSQIESCSIFDLTGRLLHKERNSKSIDISRLTGGSYFVLIETDEGIVRKKFIKTNK